MTTPTTPTTGTTIRQPTTETPAAARRPNRRGLSVRTRIVVALAVLVAVALTSAGAIIYVLESARLEAMATAQAEQELAEFSTLQSTERFVEIDDVLYTFMNRNVPSDYEMLIGWINGEPRYLSTQQHPELVENSAFLAEIRDLADQGGIAYVASPVGELLLTVQPVAEVAAPSGTTAAADSGALVVVTFLDGSRAELTSLIRTYAVVALLSLGAITVLAQWQAGRLLAPLRRLNDAAREIGSGDLSRRIDESGNDDITALTRTVNDMLARLEHSFTAQRRFLDDAGHELRTPLTVLRGHLELLETGDPDEIAETKALLLDEVDRMSRLVGDMALLAKSNRPDFLALDTVELDAFTRSAFAKAGALGDRDWRLDAVSQATLRADPQRLTQAVLAKATALGDRAWCLDEVARGRTVLDEQRITQALLQLADNAVKHTDPGAEIGLGSEAREGQVRIWVRDTGDGVPEADRTIIFERFGRGPVRHGDEGFGLGLSIVKAIAEAHGGRVSVADASGQGAVFSLILPLPANQVSLQEVPWRAS
jgi:two-component system OmpR family sensor kinase